MTGSCPKHDNGSARQNIQRDPSTLLQPELIVFYEVSSQNIKQILQDVPFLGDFPYPYEYHVTVGIFSNRSADTLRLWAESTVNFLSEMANKEEVRLIRVIVDRASRSEGFGRGFRFLFSDGPESSRLIKASEELANFMADNGISLSENMPAYLPHVTFTPPLVNDQISSEQESMILRNINNRILTNSRELSSLDFIAARSILKFEDDSGRIIKEIWDRPI